MPVKKGILKNSGPLTLPLSADRKSATDEAVADFLSADICYSKCIAPNNYGEMFGCVCYGRGRRTRTLDLRFWRPLFYQLNYTPVCATSLL